jgi:hypothetical protein
MTGPAPGLRLAPIWSPTEVKAQVGAQKTGVQKADANRGHQAKVNETLYKILCHNLVVLIHEMCELGIDPVFWPSGTVV